MVGFPKIWLLRHGETHWNAQGRIQGQLESDLTALGKEQAQAQARIMAPVLAANPACFVSPLGRAQQTAQIALGGRSFTTDQRLAEAYAGALQGLTRPEADSRWPGIIAANPNSLDLFCEAPDGEGYASFLARISDFMTHLRGPSVVVAHGLLGQVIRGLVLGLERRDMAVLPNEQGCVYLLENGTETVLR
ncbi:histidine phosphatase family protein [Aliisedimentitalea scapharcae]|uniref:Histidine phosphatase family protein n=1 Tax=Aliisedimentitalea scapharcae TaxID=1524259 RepID=A0ABZ2XSM2_9RHOB